MAYESQLKSDRAELHRRLATTIEEHDPESADENAAFIAQHLEAAGDLRAALTGTSCRQHGQPTAIRRGSAKLGTSPVDRGLVARERAGRTAMRIAPRTMLCATAWRPHSKVPIPIRRAGELCRPRGTAVLASGMAGCWWPSTHQRPRAGGVAGVLRAHGVGRVDREPTLTLRFLATTLAHCEGCERGKWPKVLRWSQTIIDLAHGDPTKGRPRYRFAVGGCVGQCAAPPDTPEAIPGGATTLTEPPPRLAEPTCGRVRLPSESPWF